MAQRRTALLGPDLILQEAPRSPSRNQILHCALNVEGIAPASVCTAQGRGPRGATQCVALSC